jgi:glycosyltransferase involved in cell wall biosynthesis
MKIGVDLRQLSLGASGGITQLVQGVFGAAFNQYSEHQFLIFCTPFNRSLLTCNAENVGYFSLSIASYFQDLDRIAAEEHLQVLFRSYPTEDTLQFPMDKQIVLIPDNQHETFPDFFAAEVLRARRSAFSKALVSAGAIGTISEFSRKVLLNFPGTRCEDIFLMEPSLQVAHGLRRGNQGIGESEREVIPDGEYFLFPANLWKHKNHQRLLQAFRLLREKTRREISLVLTGHPAGWSELSKEISDLPVIHLGFVRPELLRVLLERARALVFFSLYEGFGMPLLEAFDAGTPVICSNTTSLPEVGGDAVVTCDPTDVDAMAALMERILKDDALRETLVKRGKSRLDIYSWEKSADNLIAACERVGARQTAVTGSRAASDAALPLVSIVTPSYNQGRFLKRTIDSVLMQSYPNIQYIVIDGGSSDGSVEILQSYRDRFYWISEPDRGQTNAINKGFARAKGEILAYLNSDDILAPRAIERVVQYLQKNPECDMVYGEADYIDEQDRIIGSYKTADYSFNRLIEDCMVCQPAAFWRKRMMEKVGPFDEQLNFAMDYEYWLRIAKAGGEIRFLREKLACSRLYSENKTLSARPKIFQEIFEICRRHTGYVHQSYYQGYWHHRIYEEDNRASRLLRRYHVSYTMLAWFHHKWNHRDRYGLAWVASALAKKVAQRVAAAGVRAKGFVKRSSTFATLRRNDSVKGFWPDNWLEPKLTIPPKSRARGQVLHLAGVAPIDQTMTVAVGDRKICKCDFEAHQYMKVSFLADLVGGERISIRFSSFVEDPGKRRLAFLLQDTNVFSEQDTY